MPIFPAERKSRAIFILFFVFITKSLFSSVNLRFSSFLLPRSPDISRDFPGSPGISRFLPAISRYFLGSPWYYRLSPAISVVLFSREYGNFAVSVVFIYALTNSLILSLHIRVLFGSLLIVRSSNLSQWKDGVGSSIQQTVEGDFDETHS